jgi:hypothetical protein
MVEVVISLQRIVTSKDVLVVGEHSLQEAGYRTEAM